MAGRALLSGNEAIALGAFEAGVSVAAGYPGTPSTEILENLVKYQGVRCQWSPNEKVAMEVASGASWAGARALVTMKHVGLNVAADPLFTLAYTGVVGGLVVITADDPQLFSSQNEQDNRHYARAAKVPLLEPSDSQEAKDLTVAAFDISEKFDTPVLLRTTTRLSHSMCPVLAGEARPRREGRRPEKNVQKMVMVPAHGFRRHVEVEKRRPALQEFAEVFPGNRIEMGDTAVGIIASGVAYMHAREVMPQASFLKLAMPHPLPARLVAEFASMVRKLIVVEELDPFIEEQVRALGLTVHGKDMLPAVGEYTPGLLSRALLGREAAGAAVPGGLTVPGRPPILCPGCPHRGIFHLLGKRKYFVAGDIGCYTLAALPPLSALDTCLCMGASLGQALGIEKALGGRREKVAAVIGDSTFFHSGLTPLLDIVHNAGRTTVIVLDNRTTAMTGRQDHPGIGRNLMGQTVKEVDIAAVARAVGVDQVLESDAFDLNSIGAALDKAEAAEGSTLIVNRGPCVLVKRSAGEALTVEAASCTGCRACLMIGCPALGWAGDAVNAKGRPGVVVIDPSLCNGCGVCPQVCRFGAIVRTAGGGR